MSDANRIIEEYWPPLRTEQSNVVMAVFVNLSGEAAETDFTCTVPYSEAVDLRSGTPLAGAHICLADAAPVYVFLKK